MKKIFIIIVILIILIYGFSPKKSIIYEIKSGATITKIANNLENIGVINSKYALIILAKIKKTIPKVGYYEFNNIIDFLDKIHNYKVKTGFITLVPGKKIKDYYQQIKNTKFIKTSKNLQEIMLSLKIPKPYEGRFLPQTYKFNYGDSAKSIFKRSYELMRENIDKVWQKRVKNKYITSKYQLLILASIVEKESGNKLEMSKIAGVFINRFKKNMRLQSDATTVYGLGKNYTGRLTKKNLRTKNKYNTYKINGLPIGAIANPSLNAIIFTSKPENHNLFYFVAKNNKEHIFAKTYKQHRKNIKKYIKAPYTK
jgi:UPF0755 protein